MTLSLFVGCTYSYNISCLPGPAGCYYQTLDCLVNTECNVFCIGNGVCQDATINGNNASSLNVICHGTAACYGATINPGAGDLTVVGGVGPNNLASTKIKCPNNAICNITCTMDQGCQGASIYGALSTLYVYVLGDFYNVMSNGASIYCPNDGLYGNTNNCNLFFDNGDNVPLHIYAVEGVNDINIYCTVNCIRKTGSRPIIKCTEYFTSECPLSALLNQPESEWTCVDYDGFPINSICATYFIPTNHPTTAPSNSPTTSPTKAPSTSPLILPYSSGNILYVRNNGCDVGDCSSSKGQYDYDSMCQNQHIYQTDICCQNYPQPPTQTSTYNHSKIPNECQSHAITTITSNAIFNNSYS
eukprot:58157_1